ncbi:MAG: choice-of-anchor Q domain-containing protein [Thermodesulfobacteriota bacterium]
MKIVVFLIAFGFLVFAVFGNASSAATYYVDAAQGSDTAPGTSPTTAWRTLEQVNNAPLNPGDIILFKRGGAWREFLRPQSGSEAGRIVYGAYGTGHKPLFLGSLAKNEVSHWTHEGGNIWATTRPALLATELFPNPSFETNADGWAIYFDTTKAQGTGARDASVFDTAPAGYRIDCANAGGDIIDVQFFTTSSFAITSGNFYRLAFKAKSTSNFSIPSILLMTDSGSWSARYHTNYSPMITREWQTYEILFRSDITAADGRINFYLGGALPAGSTLYLDSLSLKEFSAKDLPYVDIGNLIFDAEASCGVKVWNQENLSHQGEFWYDEDKWILKVYSTENPASYYSGIECALARFMIDQTDRRHITYENLSLRYGGAHGIAGGETHHITVRNCDFSYIGGGDQIGGSGELRYGNGIEFWNNAHDTLVEGCRLWEIYDAALTTQGEGENIKRNQYFRNNVIWNCEYSFELWNFPESSVTDNISFENNTCACSGYGWGHAQRFDPSGRHLCFFSNEAATTNITIQNNIFFSAREAAISITGEWNGIEDMALDYNAYYQVSPDTMLVYWKGRSYQNNEFSSYQAETGKDHNSINSDPLFVNRGQHNYKIRAGSLCIDHGNNNTPALADKDIEGNPRVVHGIVDLGAYEFIINGSVAPVLILLW